MTTFLTCVVCSQRVAKKEVLLGRSRGVDDQRCVCGRCLAGASRPTTGAGVGVARSRSHLPWALGTAAVALAVLALWLALRSEPGSRDDVGGEMAAAPSPDPVTATARSVAAEVPQAPPFSATAGRPLRREELERIQQATVWIRTVDGVGSGFLFRRHHTDPTLIATNYHVIAPAGRRHEEVSVVLGSGTAAEERRQARLVALSAGDDLAVLRLDGTSASGAFLRFSDQPVIETQPVRIAGFPFGDLLERRAASSPRLTFTGGAVSSLRYGENDLLERVQLDADINPGNSGGPVLDDQGRVVGVAVETVQTTDISFMIPVEALDRLLDGIVTRVSAEVRGSVLRVGLEVQDPLSRLVEVGLNAFPPGREPTEAHRSWPYAVGGRTAVTRTSPAGQVFLEIPLAADDQLLWFQPWFERDSGVIGLAPFSIDLRAGVGLEVPPAEVHRAEAQAEDWLGGVGRWAEKSKIRPRVTGEDLGGIPRRTGGIGYRELRILAGRVQEIEWAPRGDWFYLLEGEGTVRRVSARTLREERNVALDMFSKGFVASRRGLLVTLPGVGEVVILGFDDLEVQAAISGPALETITSAPRLDVAFGLSLGGSRIAVFDLEERRLRGELSLSDTLRAGCQSSSKSLALFRSFRATDLRATPDGRYLLLAAQGSLIRLHVEDDRLECGEIGPDLGISANSRIALSGDGRYVALPNGRNQRIGAGGPETGTHVFRVDDLSRPVVTVATKDQFQPEVLAFDTRGSRIFGFDRRNRVTVYSRGGVAKESADFGQQVGSPRAVYISPDGGGGVLVTGPRLIYFELD